MNLRRIKHILLRLSAEEKVVGIGALIVLVSAFLPWYSVTSVVEKDVITQSGFSGDIGVMGFVVFLLTLISLAFLLADHIHIKLPKFGHEKEKIILFLMGQAAFLSLLIIAVYTKRSLEYTNAELRFGLYLSLIGAAVGTFAAYAQIQKLQKKATQDFFANPEEPSDEENSAPADEITDTKETIHKAPAKNIKTTHKTEQKNFFYEKNSAEDTVAEPAKANGGDDDEEYFKNTDEEVAEEQNYENDEDLDFEMTDKNLQEDLGDAEEQYIKEEESKEKLAGQGSYFIREAGVEKKPTVKINVESVTPGKKTEDLPPEEIKQDDKKPESANQTMSFYDDL
jgi:hypothetical protein